ncbi:MAG: NRDE family protein [Cyclobacteriaceae bacterium]
MCLIFLSVNNHPKYKVVIAANRDEFYQRKTAPASFWQDQPDILAGRDLEAGGTWMGISRSGRISLVTNYRDPKNIDPKAPSRGHLVSDFLSGTDAPDSYLKNLIEKAHQYNGFNLIVGEMDNLRYYSNYDSKIRKLQGGIYGLSNHLLDTPWPKVEKGKKKFAELIQSPALEASQLLDMMYDEERASDNYLPDTGIGLERERALSSMFIKTPNYGSRSSTVLLVDRRGQMEFTERVYDLSTFNHQTRSFQIK